MMTRQIGRSLNHSELRWDGNLSHVRTILFSKYSIEVEFLNSGFSFVSSFQQDEFENFEKLSKLTIPVDHDLASYKEQADQVEVGQEGIYYHFSFGKSKFTTVIFLDNEEIKKLNKKIRNIDDEWCLP